MSTAKTLLVKIPAREWRGLTPAWAGGRLHIPLKCTQCGSEDHWSAANMVGPQTALPKIIQLGWGVGRKLLCPMCVRKFRHKPKVNVMGNTPQSKDTADVKAFDDAKRNKRLVILALEDYYDEHRKQYRPDKSDAVIAAELNLSVKFIASVREEFYGKLAEPEEISDLRAELGGLMLNGQELERKIAAICARNGWLP